MALHLVADADGHMWDGVGALVAAEGSGAHHQSRRLCAADRRSGGDRRGTERGAADWVERRLAQPARPAGHMPMARRVDLADAIHALCAVHGVHRGLADEARVHPAVGPAAAWLDEVAAGMAAERALLSRTVAAAGPLPSTPGQAATDAAFVTQRHAFRMLARSDRAGVATGAAAALALDWVMIRAVIARAAEAYGVALPPLTLPAPADTAAVLGRLADGAGLERAMMFGARALLDQHRALWSLLEARAIAREG